MRKRLSLLFITIAILLSVSAAVSLAEIQVPADAKYYKGHAYKVFDLGKTWAAARNYCTDLGGHLVTITSAGEQDFVKKLLEPHSKNSYWLGGLKSGTNWAWITKESWSYTHWGSGQPDNYRGAEDRLMMYRHTNPLSSGGVYGTWNDLKGDGTCNNEPFFGKNNFGFICEWEVGDLSEAVVTLSETRYVYDGSAKKPTITVKLFGKKLKESTDYTVTYKNNTDIGTAMVTVKGKGNYTGSVKAAFTIIPGKASLSAVSEEAGSARLTVIKAVKGATGYEYTYTDVKTKKTITIQSNKLTCEIAGLEGGQKYTFTARAYTLASNGRIYYGDHSKEVKATIIAGKDISEGKMTIGKKNDVYTYTGSGIEPPVKVKYDLSTLKEGTDYTLIFKNNINAGTATVTAKGIGKYTGELSGTFVIGKASMLYVAVSFGKSVYTYTGSAIKPKISTLYCGKSLVKGTDYKVTYEDNKNAGTAHVIFEGIGNFKDGIGKSFTIDPLPLNECEVTLPDGEIYGYTGEKIEPAVLVKHGKTTIPMNSKTYKVFYKNNIDGGKAKAVVKGTGNLTGSVTLEFEIARQLVSPVPDGCHFNMKTLDKPKGWTGYHDININVSESTPVYAIANGTVICSQKYTTIDGKDYLTSYGNCINFTSDEIDGKVYTAVYAHLSKISVPGVKQIIPSTDTRQQRGGSSKPLNNGKSVRVKAGDIIGYIGMTGNAGGLHLHIEIYENSKRIDPTDLFPQLKK